MKSLDPRAANTIWAEAARMTGWKGIFATAVGGVCVEELSDSVVDKAAGWLLIGGGVCLVARGD